MWCSYAVWFDASFSVRINLLLSFQVVKQGSQGSLVCPCSICSHVRTNMPEVQNWKTCFFIALATSCCFDLLETLAQVWVNTQMLLQFDKVDSKVKRGSTCKSHGPCFFQCIFKIAEMAVQLHNGIQPLVFLILNDSLTDLNFKWLGILSRQGVKFQVSQWDPWMVWSCTLKSAS